MNRGRPPLAASFPGMPAPSGARLYGRGITATSIVFSQPPRSGFAKQPRPLSCTLAGTTNPASVRTLLQVTLRGGAPTQSATLIRQKNDTTVKRFVDGYFRATKYMAASLSDSRMR